LAEAADVAQILDVIVVADIVVVDVVAALGTVEDILLKYKWSKSKQ
jgi:hypothetical protein